VQDAGFFSILVIALGLSADCFAVALGGSLSQKKFRIGLLLRLALAFGIFQAGMTWLGWLAGSTVIDYIAAYDHWLAFGLLAFIGGRMIWESFRPDGARPKGAGPGGWWTLLLLSLATSLDAMAVGLSLAFLQVNIALAALTIGLVALAVTATGFASGRRLGALVGKRAEAIGGAILIIIGIRLLLEHLL
jgi:putative Mn2+ efflux pump MntP